MIPRGNQTTIINKLNGKRSEQRFFRGKGSILFMKAGILGSFSTDMSFKCYILSFQ